MFGWLIGVYAKAERSTGNYNPWYPSQLSPLTHFRLALTYGKVVLFQSLNGQPGLTNRRRFMSGSGLLD